MSPDTTRDARHATAERAAALLADSYTLYLKTHNFHWNVKGPHFAALHLLFEGQYQELALAVDQIAERIQSLGFRAPGSYAEFTRLSSVADARGNPGAEDMLRELAADQDKVVATARRLLDVAEEAGDEASVDLAVQRMQVHEKTRWMLRSHLEGAAEPLDA